MLPVTNSHKPFRTWTALATLSAAAVISAAACSSSDSLTCGTGTSQSGKQCIVAAATGGSGGAGGSGGGSTTGGSGPDAGTVGPTFAGITSAAPASDIAVQVTWAPATDTVTPAANMVYNVYVASTAGDENYGKPTMVSPAGGTSVLVGGLQPDTDYFFVVRALDTIGVEDTNTVEIKGTPTLDKTAPTFAGATSAKTVADNSVEISWDAASDDLTDAAGIAYTITWSDSAKTAPDGTLGILTAPGVTSAVVSNLPNPKTKYFFTVRARDAAGNTDDNSVAVSGTTGKDETAPVFGGCTAVANPGATTATVTWDSAKDDTTTPDKITYNVYAFEKGVDSDTLFGNPAGTFTGGTSGVVDGLKPKTGYYFVCRAQDASGNEDQNLFFRTVTTLIDSAPPTFTGLAGAVAGSTTVTLNWAAASDDQSKPEEIVYLVYESETDGDVLTQKTPVATSEPGATSIQITDLKSASQYYFLVRARDKALNEDDNKQATPVQTLVSFAYDVQPILSTYCAKAGCHVAGNPPQGLIMSAGFAYTYLVGQTSVEAPWLKRIDPTATDAITLKGSDPTPAQPIDTTCSGKAPGCVPWNTNEPVHKSYLIRKLLGVGDTTVDGHAAPLGVSPVMPPEGSGNSRPPPDARDLIERWNQEGAQNN